MRKKLASAEEIISRETLMDDEGKKIGEKVVGRFKSNAGRKFQVLWTNGSDLKIVSGPSVDHVLQLLKPGCSF